jgi:hypothetical protein
VSTTLVAARRKLAQELGGFGVFTATGGSSTTLVCAAAFQSTELPASNLAYAWVYVPGGTGAKQRRVKAGGLDPATGTITVDAAFGASIANGTVFELHSRLPAVREPVADQGVANVLGVQECLNLALRHILVEDDTLSLALVNLQRDYSLSSWAWLDRAERLLQVREPTADGAAYEPIWRTYEFREGVAGNTLHFPRPYRFSSGSYSVKLVALRPGDTKIKVGGVWGDSTTGYANETDEAGPDLNALVTVGKAFAYQTLRDARRGTDKYAALYAQWVQMARMVRGYDHSNEIDSTVPTEAAASGGQAA